MNNEQFERNLQSVGQACFVEFFDDFSSKTISREDVVELLSSKTKYTEKSCISRTGHARSIINAGRAQEALEKIINSSSARVTVPTKEKAKELLSKLNT